MFSILEYGARQLKNVALRIKFLILHFFTDTPFVKFTCNICGKSCKSPVSFVNHREQASCYHCGSNRRFRSIIAALATELFGKDLLIDSLAKQEKINGIGMSDAAIYARLLQQKFNYRNTFYHKSPHLDIQQIDEKQYKRYDFIITSDVFEHVPPPVETAFRNLYNMLKPDGVCIFSVPYNIEGQTVEHYPDLYEYQIKNQSGRYILLNTTRDGEKQKFANLRFHGGPGSTLEMRVFALNDLLENIKSAGFSHIHLHNESIPEYGIFISADSPSLIISMRRK